MKKILVTGGAGFIGSAVIRHILSVSKYKVVNLDAITYAGNLDSLKSFEEHVDYCFEKVNICDVRALHRVFFDHQPDALMHLAAESHVDRSIDAPQAFVQTNVVGTANLLQVAQEYWASLSQKRRDNFRFHHISTDEVYGDLAGTEALFTEETAYNPSSPYSASKASSDHLVRAWHRTYGFPVVITNCSNNYGPYQFPEKLIPHIILNALQGKPLPIYGDGQQIRDWLEVDDHARALVLVALEGEVGETYNIGGHNEKTNLEVVTQICSLLDELVPERRQGVESYSELITFVRDRPGHDLRYAIDASKIDQELGWKPKETFESGLRKTVQWYLDNEWWWSRVLDGSYRGERLG